VRLAVYGDGVGGCGMQRWRWRAEGQREGGRVDHGVEPPGGVICDRCGVAGLAPARGRPWWRQGLDMAEGMKVGVTVRDISGPFLRNWIWRRCGLVWDRPARQFLISNLN
jgi:hypothetical protein